MEPWTRDTIFFVIFWSLWNVSPNYNGNSDGNYEMSPQERENDNYLYMYDFICIEFTFIFK
jgi:hypothetical protein